ncbi:hypothetical protein GTY86_34550, partial [Streptomyces sp. SID5770]|uniref:hypothetical protein n=1 Tax=Streptomyces sp. SID5770 TaxID=2690308 RepID=UPI0013865AD2
DAEARPDAVVAPAPEDPATAASPRLLELLGLVEDSPGLDVLGPYLDDADPAVRAAAVAALGETAPAGAG